MDDLEAARQSLTATTAVDVDLRATYAYLRYGWDVSRGTIDPEDVDPEWHVYFTAGQEDGALKRVPDVYGLDRRHVAAETNTQ